MREDDHSCKDGLALGVQGEYKLCNHPEVGSTPSDGPEEVGVLCGAGSEDCPICGNNGDLEV